jgi:hypothetical protein
MTAKKKGHARSPEAIAKFKATWEAKRRAKQSENSLPLNAIPDKHPSTKPAKEKGTGKVPYEATLRRILLMRHARRLHDMSMKQLLAELDSILTQEK